MSFISRIFTRKDPHQDIKELLDEVSEQNELYRIYLSNLVQGSKLSKDGNQKSYVRDGFEKNADVFSIVDRASTMYGQMMRGLKVVQGEDEKDVISSPLTELIKQPNNFQVMSEFAKLQETFYLVTGNAIIYAPKLENGNNAGQLMPGGMYMMPTQHVDIKANSWRDPIGHYTLDINETEQIDAKNVIHMRMPNLQYEDGKNFMGMSPIKVAAMIIEAENQGYQIVADTLGRGLPPGILTKVGEQYDPVRSPEQQDSLEKAYRRKYGNQATSRRAGVPITGWGDLRWIQIGFSNFRDLQIIENNQNGMRVLCNVWSMPSAAFNDTAGSALATNNQKEFRRAVYTNRLLPDANLFLEYLNAQIAPAYGEGIKIVLDVSSIPELQESMIDLVNWMKPLTDNGTLTRNQVLEKLGFERSENPVMDQNLVPFNLMPIDQVGGGLSAGEAGKILEREEIDDYKYIRMTG